ncbi:hypothetical protein R5W24_002951 [Gemmata sp. JC717]|uniref:Exosortase-associated EpsI family protein n=1 Tax=Gemmata algarum TaxID=2975278 RepID=A0ABU5EZB1_9BACT|nr:hypothetical protein [Gemmata algarum]MDY3553837.1 hypothetical protein [Gemmata algarum]MDY3559016.1 hypothetical protein [Gemmata algarum]
MMKPLTFCSVLALVVCGAFVHGAVTQRWNIVASNTERTARLHDLEVKFEDLRSEPVDTEMPLNERSVATSRRYFGAGGSVAVVSFISGIPGSVATHTPDVCYPGSGYKTLRATRKETFEVNGAPAAVYVADFEKKTQTKVDRVRVRWAWTTDGAWVAPDNPRWQFASQLRAPTIYKVYIASSLPESDTEVEDDPVVKGFVAATWAQYGAACARP